MVLSTTDIGSHSTTPFGLFSSDTIPAFNLKCDVHSTIHLNAYTILIWVLPVVTSDISNISIFQLWSRAITGLKSLSSYDNFFQSHVTVIVHLLFRATGDVHSIVQFGPHDDVDLPSTVIIQVFLSENL